MRLHFSLAAALVVFGFGGSALAQTVQPVPQVPTTVQLPTFSFFTVQTTVSVPDGGSMSLAGGINRAADGTVTRGMAPPNRGIGSTRGASGVSVHARILDREQMDKAVLAEAAAKRSETISSMLARTAATAGRASSGTAVESVAAIRQKNAAAAAEQNSEAAEFFVKAQQAEAEGKAGTAKIYYQMVLSRDKGQLKQQAQVRLGALSGGKLTAVTQR
jgi:hypothetical protein